MANNKKDTNSLNLADMTPEKGIAVDAMKPADNKVSRVDKIEYKAHDGSPIIREDIY